MVQNNKVLTVSYGTFSCTLEGFEDSFDTMKAIAEYFRDLAADDRYFGAEPPQPDADMLARIAQREIARQVEARTSDEGIHLRAANPAAPAPVHAPQPGLSEELQEPGATEEKRRPQDHAPDENGSMDTVAENASDPVEGDAPDEDHADASEDRADQQPPAPDANKIAAISAAVATQETPQEPDTAEAPAASAMAETDAPAETSSAESIAAKLRRIRAVVSQSPEEEFSEDEHADSILPETAADELTQSLADDTEEPTALDPETDEDDEISRVLSQLTAKPAVEDDVPENAAEQAAEDTTEIAPPDAPPQRRARIIKVKRAQIEQATRSDAMEETPAVQKPATGTDSSLSEEDEDDLMRELAAVEADLLAASAEDEAPLGDSAEDQAHSPQAPQPDPEHSAPRLADSDVSRLMAAADEKLTAPETASSRETYSHLRAAVAAAEADGSAGNTNTESGEKPYREDLASVVKPRRPAAGSEAEPLKLKSEMRPAPLKLVAEQRIDPVPAPEPTAPTPVRPRRISVLDDGASAATDGKSDFAEYARESGAVELSELLEAAAAYMSFVEGRDHFSRPQLMNAVRRSGAAEFNREDGLRSFGQLLREGKIERSENGRFAATEEIGFRPAKRAAG